MRDVRFGSYSIAATLAGMPNLSRRKSIRRYCRLCPPPCHRFVMWPLLLRPPVRLSGSSSDFSASPLVTSAKSETERNRVAGVIGRNCRMPISALEHLDRKSTRLNSSHEWISYAVFCLKKKKKRKNSFDPSKNKTYEIKMKK